MRLLLCLSFLFLLSFVEVSSIQCYYGNLMPNMMGEMTGTSKVKLMTCPKTHRCCSKITSPSGISLQCAKECPGKKASCGPTGKSGIDDAKWCYCKSYRDKNCQPATVL